MRIIILVLGCVFIALTVSALGRILFPDALWTRLLFNISGGALGGWIVGRIFL